MDTLSCESDRLTPEEIQHVANEVFDSLLPPKSRSKYLKSYETFMTWKDEKQVKSFSESVFLAYFSELSKKMKPSSLWAVYSMLKNTVYKKHNVNIQEYTKIRALLKQLSHGFVSKKSNVLTAQHVETFLNKAPDFKYLLAKVVLIFGVNGACNTTELMNITMDDIEIHNEMLLVKLSNRTTKRKRVFVIRDDFLKLVQKYQALRPADIPSKRFFLNYNNGKCTKQVIGRNKFGTIPKQIASYLKLKNPKSYSGHCFRRTSRKLRPGFSTYLTALNSPGSWKPDQESESVENKQKLADQSMESINLHQSTSPRPSNYYENVKIELNQYSSTSYADEFKITSQQCVSTSTQGVDRPYNNHTNKPAEVYLEDQAEIYLEENSYGSISDEDNKPIIVLRDSIKNKVSVDTTNEDIKKNETNEIALYGQLVACKIEKLGNRNRLIAQNRINNILYDLEMQETTES